MRVFFVTNFILVCIFVTTNLLAEDKNNNAAELYLQASKFLKGSYSQQSGQQPDFWNLFKFDKDKTPLNTDVLNSFGELQKALIIVRQANEIGNCVWDPAESAMQKMLICSDFLDLEGDISFVDEAIFLNSVLRFRMYELLQNSKYERSIDYWYDSIVLSRRITYAKWLVCYSVGTREEIETTNIILRFIDQMNKREAQKLLSLIKKLPKRLDCYDCMKNDIDFIYKRFLTHRLYAVFRSIIKSEYLFGDFISEYLDMLTLPIKIYGREHSVYEWLWAICCLINVNEKEVETYLTGYTELAKLPLFEFKKMEKEYIEKVKNIQNIYLRAVILSMLPSYLGKTFYEPEAIKSEQTLIEKLMLRKITLEKQSQ
jgi:hypothetical protein